MRILLPAACNFDASVGIVSGSNKQRYLIDHEEAVPIAAHS
jgi:hypothetical protein